MAPLAFYAPSPLARLAANPARLIYSRRPRRFSTVTPPYASIRPKQSLSQNFLRDKDVIQRIITSFSEIHEQSPESQVVEVGPGLGALTGDLIKRFPEMHAIELDQRAVAYLRETYPSLSLLHGDVLQVDWGKMKAEYGSPLSLIGNLPYNIVSQILFSIFETPPGTIDYALVMMQKEVAERIVSPTRKKSYGILSIVAQLYSQPEILFTVAGKSFYPKPDVTSCMVKFRMISDETFDRSDIALAASLRRIIRAAFNQRRKVMRNSLRDVCPTLPDGWETKRAEELTPRDFLSLAHTYKREEPENQKTVWR